MCFVKDMNPFRSALDTVQETVSTPLPQLVRLDSDNDGSPDKTGALRAGVATLLLAGAGLAATKVAGKMRKRKPARSQYRRNTAPWSAGGRPRRYNNRRRNSYGYRRRNSYGW